jgi:hypothetical protein
MDVGDGDAGGGTVSWGGKGTSCALTLECCSGGIGIVSCFVGATGGRTSLLPFSAPSGAMSGGLAPGGGHGGQHSDQARQHVGRKPQQGSHGIT